MANRFSQPIQPYVVNPISVDIFSMIPLAKARAKALGVRATESLLFDFDIDKKDASYIQPSVNEVQTQKNIIIDRIQKEGISEDLISNFIQIKRQYDVVQADVGKAEDTKKRIDVWNNKILALHKDNPNYLQYVKGKEYEQGWKGTFNEDGSVNTFDPQLGPKYFDIVADFSAELSRLPDQLEKEIAGGGYFSTITDPTTGQPRTIFTNAQQKRIYSNRSNLLKRVEALKNDYKNESTARGAYKQYSELTDQYVDETANRIMNSLIHERIEGGSRSRQLVNLPSGTSSKEVDPLVTKSNTFYYQGVTDPPIAQKELEAITENKIISNLGYAFNVAGLFFKGLYPGENIGLISTLTESQKEFNALSDEKKAEILGTSVNKFKSDYKSNVIDLNQKFEDAKYGKIELDPVDIEFASEAGAEILSNVGESSYSTDRDFLDNLDDYYKNIGSSLMPYTFFQNNASNLLKAQGVKDVSNKAYIADLVSLGNVTTGNTKVKKLNDNRVLNPADKNDKLLLGHLESGMAFFGNVGGVGKSKGKYNIRFVGNGGSQPGLYTSFDETTKTHRYNKELAYGTVVNLVRMDEDGDVEEYLGEFLVGTTTGNRSSTAFKERSKRMEALANLPYGHIMDGSIIRRINEKGETAIANIEIEKNSIPRRGLNSSGELITIPKGQLVYYTEQDFLPRLYNQAELMNLNLTGLPVKEGKNKIKQKSAGWLQSYDQETFTNYVNNAIATEQYIQQFNK